MKKVMTNAEKIKKIKDERKQLLEMTKDSIKDNKGKLVGEIGKLLDTLKEDEKNVKKYEALVKAKSLVEDLIEQILEANSVEDVISIRKKLNYYINKIKKELLSRGIDKEELSNYLDLVGSIRKDIAKTVRFLKRETTVDYIDMLSNKKELSADDLDVLRYLVKKEMRYNNSYLKADSKKTNVSKNTKVISKDEIIEDKKEVTTPEIIETFSLLNCATQSQGSYLERIDTLADKANEHMSRVNRLISESREMIGDVQSEYGPNDIDRIITEVKGADINLVSEDCEVKTTPSEDIAPIYDNESCRARVDVLVKKADSHIAGVDKLIAEAKELIGEEYEESDIVSHDIDSIITEEKADDIEQFVLISDPNQELIPSHSSLIPMDVTNQAKVDILANRANEHMEAVDKLIVESKKLVGIPSYTYCPETLDSIIAEVKGETPKNVDAVGFEVTSTDVASSSVKDCEDDSVIELFSEFINSGNEDNTTFVSKMIPKYRRHYNIRRTHTYSGTVSEDLFTLLKNIPTYIHNKGCIRRMEDDTRFYCGNDFAGYIDYLKRKTSIKYALKMIFDKSYFGSLEGECLNNHEKCVSWVVDYCNREEYYCYTPQKVKTL